MHSSAKLCTRGSGCPKISEFPCIPAFVVQTLLPNLKLLAELRLLQLLERIEVVGFSVTWLGVTRRDQEGKRKGEKVNEEEDKGTVALH
jgi:hypothetical protein